MSLFFSSFVYVQSKVLVWGEYEYSKRVYFNRVDDCSCNNWYISNCSSAYLPDYVVRSQLTTALAELNGAKIQYELVVNDGSVGTQFTLDGMNLSSNSKLCNYVVYAPVAGVSTPALECRLTKSTVSVAILGQSIQLNRGANGFWYCSVSVGIANRYKPANCS